MFGSRALAPLTQRNFRWLWIGQAVSAAGDALLPVALAFATLSIARTASALGLVLAASTIARIIALPVGGVWADRLPRQLVMLSSDAVRAVAQSAIAALLITGHAELWHLVVASILFSLAGGFFTPASAALVPQTVSTESLQQANALMGLSRSVTNVGGPAIAGILVAVISPGWVFAIDAATFVVSAASLALLRIPRSQPAARAGFWLELAEGWRAVTSRRWFLLNLSSHALWNFAIAALFVLGPLVAKQHLGGPAAWGLISAAIGAGSILGGLVALRFVPGRPLVAANLALTPSALQLLALAVPLPTAAIIAAAIVGWAGLTYLNEVWFATVPHLMPPEVLGRANSFDWLLSIIAMPAGFAIAGPVADHIGTSATLVAAAILISVPSFLIVLVPGVRNVRRLPEGRIVLAESRQQIARAAWLPLETQAAFREQYRAARPGWLSSGDQFDAVVEERLTPEMAVLDLGCGRSGGIERFWRRARVAVGIDPDLQSLADRRQGMAVLQGGGEHLPFAGASFDMVVSVWVLEHLEAPERVFKEVARVLKPGGHFIFLTPNALNPLVFGNRAGQMAPWLQQRLVAKVYGREKGDTFTVRYRANTTSRLRAIAGESGFSVADLKVIADPTYMAFNAPLFRVAMLAERLLPRGLGVHLLGDLERT